MGQTVSHGWADGYSMRYSADDQADCIAIRRDRTLRVILVNRKLTLGPASARNKLVREGGSRPLSPSFEKRRPLGGSFALPPDATFSRRDPDPNPNPIPFCASTRRCASLVLSCACRDRLELERVASSRIRDASIAFRTARPCLGTAGRGAVWVDLASGL